LEWLLSDNALERRLRKNIGELRAQFDHRRVVEMWETHLLDGLGD